MHHTKAFVSVLAAVAVFNVNASSAIAQDPIHKAGRGIVNVLTGWIELPKNFDLGRQEENPILGMGWGLVKGSGLTLTRVVVGAYEALTFPLPIPKDYASPYEGLELPDYAWE